MIAFDYMISDMLTNESVNPIVTALYIRGRKLNISLVFIIQVLLSYFAITKNIRLNSTQYLILKIPSRRELHQTAFNHFSDIEFKDFMNFCEKKHSKTIFFFDNWL